MALAISKPKYILVLLLIGPIRCSNGPIIIRNNKKSLCTENHARTKRKIHITYLTYYSENKKFVFRLCLVRLKSCKKTM